MSNFRRLDARVCLAVAFLLVSIGTATGDDPCDGLYGTQYDNSGFGFYCNTNGLVRFAPDKCCKVKAAVTVVSEALPDIPGVSKELIVNEAQRGCPPGTTSTTAASISRVS